MRKPDRRSRSDEALKLLGSWAATLHAAEPARARGERGLSWPAVPELTCSVGSLEICYETFGGSAAPPLLLVMGLSTQMLGWHEELCAQLAERGFFVVRFDNRDCGRSSSVRGRPPTLRQLLRRSRRAAVYTLGDMAEDGFGLMDHLGLESAHVVGASMGGMVAQTMAARRPERVRSLTSIMSSTGSRWSGQPRLRMLPILLRRAPADREGYIADTVRAYRAIGSRLSPEDEADLQKMAERAYERGPNAAGSGRQLAAIIAAGDRTRELRGIRVPTLVIHGTADKLVPLSGGRATARAIPGARLLVVKGMGHDLPRREWPRLLDAIAEHAHGADRARATASAA